MAVHVRVRVVRGCVVTRDLHQVCESAMRGKGQDQVRHTFGVAFQDRKPTCVKSIHVVRIRSSVASARHVNHLANQCRRGSPKQRQRDHHSCLERARCTDEDER